MKQVGRKYRHERRYGGRNCERKATFYTSRDANKYVKRLRVKMSVYKCPICEKYHLTSLREEEQY